jgi:hypothetical protein
MSWQAAGIVLCLIFIGIAVVGLIFEWDRNHPLPKPERDDRDWQGAFMRDCKR